MCGIIGYKGNKEAAKILLKGIKSLEYRGYDSVGLALLNKGFELKKDIGKVNEVDKKLNFLDMKGNIGVAHTRWATTGGVTKENSHPHFSQNKKIVVVHNGIIENYQELRDEIKNLGFKLVSETDTEVIPMFIEHYLSENMNFNDAVRKTLLRLKGSYAIVAINEDGQIAFGRNGSPLVLGIGEEEYFIASDVPAFLEHTKNVIYLDDFEYGFIDNGFKIFDVKTNEEKKKEIKKIEWSVEQAKKGNYPHFMMKEINEQDETIKKAVEQDLEFDKVVGVLKNANGIIFCGCGTSYHACVSSSYIFSCIAKKHVNLIIGSEFNNYECLLNKKTVMIAVSQSGETADLLEAVKTAKKHGIIVISIVNVMGSSLTRLADYNIMMNSGPEICVLSTKSYTAQLAILLLLAYSYADKKEEGKRLIIEAAAKVKEIIKNNEPKCKELAKKISDKNDMFLIGRDLAYPSALEGALKIKEVSYIHAEGFAGGELKHGTIALIEKGTPVIALTTDDTKELILSNAAEVRSRGAFVIGINSKNNRIYDYFLEVPAMNHADPILMIIPIQLLAYYLAIERNCDPDKPRNLAKSVTVK